MSTAKPGPPTRHPRWGGSELRFLDPAVLARIGSLELKARMVVDGFLSGLHRSPVHGFSAEFAEYRHYMPGDDLTSIDWKVYARSDRLYVKKFEEETNLTCHLLLDVSASMGYGSTGVTKLEYASCLAASLGYLMSKQRDAIGFMAFDDSVVTVLPASARSSHLRALLVALQRLSLGRQTNLSKPLREIADGISKRGLVVLISDLLDDPANVLEGVKHFRFRGSDVVVFQVLDPDEITFPFDRATRFQDLETDAEVTVTPGDVREDYLKAMKDLVDFYRHELALVGIDYCLLDTSQSLDFALLTYLSTRSHSY